MQTTGVDYGLRKRVFCDDLGERFDGKNMYVWFEATAHHNFSGELLGKSSQILFDALEYGVATLNICPDPPSTYFFQSGDKLFHRQRAVTTDIDAAEKGNVCVHLITV